MKYCEDCRWFKPKQFLFWTFKWNGKCTCPYFNHYGFRAVSREFAPEAHEERIGTFTSLCGPEGKLWEGKE
jgi:hypothetical protein